MKDIDVITIDGPTASGKGTVATLVAKALGFAYLDSGALYRLTAYAAIENHVDLDDEAAVAAVASQLAPSFENDRIYLSGKDVTQAIRVEEVGLAASRVAALPLVRVALTDLQKGFAKAPGLVADGRDMGTVIFPQATLKVFLTASAQARAQRRFKQLKEKGISVTIDALVRNLEERDARDTTRAASPLVKAIDAQELNSSDMTIEETVETVLRWYRAKKAKTP
ncbi:MAG TPA: (d)CMP kinase [Sutterella sp.]|nr:(d)CMP kinase [Sutterella sp.]